VKIDGSLMAPLAELPAQAKALEAAGYDGGITAETGHDPFLPLLLAAEHTERLELITAIAVAFARNPMTVAVTANDLQLASRGRLLLGLGSQVKAHIEKRFSMPWSHPAPRMREFILALRAIWQSWNTGEKLDFRGDFYQHTLMTPFFSPGPNPHGAPRVLLAAVGELMAEVCGEVADGILVHAFTTERYLRERTLPAIERGLARAGRSREGFEVVFPAFMVTGETEEEMAASAGLVRQQISFYGSTPQYRAVLELHGWGDLQGELNALSKQGRWGEMSELIEDGMVDAFAVRGRPTGIAELFLQRYGDVVDRVSLYTGEATPQMIGALRGERI
jgi:probable F420-dependent oxidoreductase